MYLIDDMRLVRKAMLFAEARHAGQVRKGSGDPYVTHPLAVSYILVAFKRSKYLAQMITAAILHDIMEDTETTFEELAREFSPFVASLVLELSNDEAEIARLGKYEYQARKMIAMSSYGLLIKLADRLHNISDQPSATMVADTLKLMRRLKTNRLLTKTQAAMVAEIERLCRQGKRRLAAAA